MISIIQVPEHWHGADVKDIERELAGLLADQKHLTYALKAHRDYELIWAFDHPEQFDTYFSVHVYGVRRHCYHAPSSDGWLPLRRSRVVRKPGTWVEVRWSATKNFDTPVRADREYGARAFRRLEWRGMGV